MGGSRGEDIGGGDRGWRFEVDRGINRGCKLLSYYYINLNTF